ncbi:MAG TPA: rhodanese-like domain-containing protein [Candidatus Binatia bacterium]|nr:rhodanese-like domain-containing protein [Candidatus Binatia bacterium]
MRTHLVRSLFSAALAALALLPALIRRWRQLGKMSSQQLQTLLSQGEPPLVLDVRNPDEFMGERGHIKEAVLFPLPELHDRLEELNVDRTRPIVTV